jgi:rhamnose utilization protein RhaD (predicted bifunctional aldolase and dehydrogenase)/NAD(P)-dependent dehydrogenase (short-subunit alcohol dehydrogenase family)
MLKRLPDWNTGAIAYGFTIVYAKLVGQHTCSTLQGVFVIDAWPTPDTHFGSALEELSFVSHLLGSDSSIVLHGGGNTSIKDTVPDITGAPMEVLYSKGSGWNLAAITPAGFAPLRLARLRELLSLPELSDSELMNQLRQASLDSAAPTPSVESLIHALLPHRVVLHSHADAVVALTNRVGGGGLVKRLYGTDTVVMPYVMPGFDLARLAATMWPRFGSERTIGLLLENHGLFTFGATAEEAYRRHVELVDRAEKEIGWPVVRAPSSPPPSPDREEFAQLRREISIAAGTPMVLRQSQSSVGASFASLDDNGPALRGPATPDHVIRTKRIPLVGRDVALFAERYRQYFDQNRDRRGSALTALDPAPRVVLDAEWGLLTAGRSVMDARIAEEIYLHTIDIIQSAENGSAYRALPAGDIFDLEYWELEQAKLHSAGAARLFDGEVALVTGAASGIGRACASALLAKGAAVVGLDLDPKVAGTFDSPAWLGVQADAASQEALAGALDLTVRSFGGLDILVPAAGIFVTSTPVAERDDAAWLRSFEVNTTAIARLFGLAHPLLAASPRGGSVVLIATKNIAAPGPGASAYSASKAAAAQLARVAALEWAPDGIRVNLVHPDAVFDTGLWTPELLAERARKYGVSTAEYKRRNLLGLEISSADVANAVVALCSQDFRATTGANLPVDGGNERVI